MSLIVENVPSDVSLRDLYSEFPESSRIMIRNNKAFVEFKSECDADAAKYRLNGKIMRGFAIKFEKSKETGNYVFIGVSSKQYEKCQICDMVGHLASECNSNKTS